MAVSIGYVAQRGAHLVVPLNADQRPAPGAPRPLDAIYPQIAGVSLTTSIGHQQYDALQTTVRKRFANGWEFLSAYTWSRGMGDGRGFFSEGGQTAEPASFWPDPTGARSGRPDRTGNPEGAREVGPGRQWFDTSVLVLPKLGTFGNAGVGIVRGPGLNVIDASATKEVHRTGRASIQLRTDVFNVLNVPVFNAPDRSLTSSTFGQILSSQLARSAALAKILVLSERAR